MPGQHQNKSEASEETVEGTSAEHSDSHATTRLIVCERSGRWAIALRHELTGVGVRVWETRALDDCWDELAQSPASMVVLELGSDVGAVLRHLTQQRRWFPAARAAVVADRSMTAYESLVREAGAAHFVASPRQAGRLAQLACRHLAQAPPPQQTLTERIWAALPWAGRR